ncbi:MAG: hypothetical protein HY569_02755 [Candidatus Magasanikbacteria bacterium]|nr:hypothetical protein [Candidatus Magasanikbacteria bacterium]
MGEVLRKPLIEEHSGRDEHKKKYRAETPAPTADQPVVIPEIQKDIEETNKDIEHKGHLLHITDERRRLQKAKRHNRDLELLEEGRKRLGGFTGEDQLKKLQTQLQTEIAVDKQKRHNKPEPETVVLGPETFEEVNIENEEKKRGNVLESDAVPPPLPHEELKNLQREYNEITEELKITSFKVLKHELAPDATLPLMKEQSQLKTRIKTLEALIKGEPTMAEKIALARTKAIKDSEAKQKPTAVEKPTEMKELSKSRPPHVVYDREAYRGPIGGIGLGNVAGAMERGSGVLRHYAGPRAGEQEIIPERTNEEALFDLDQDLAKKNTPEKLLQKLFNSEIYLDKEEHKTTILSDKTFIQALDIEKWNGDLSILKEAVGKLSLKKSDELVAIKHNKGWFKRLFKSPEEKLLETQIEALDDFAGKLVEGGKEKPTPLATKQILRAMTKR